MSMTPFPAAALYAHEQRLLQTLATPRKIQDFLDTLPINFEKQGETHYAPRVVLREKKAHCIEGALLAAAALWLHGERPLLLDLVALPHDDCHVIALYQRHGHWGAISKSNHATLRFRDPVYKTLRELSLSYFHEYFDNKTGQKTLRSYSRPLDMRRLGDSWITSEKNLWHVDRALAQLPHYPLVPRANIRLLRGADPMERKAGALIEWKEKR